MEDTPQNNPKVREMALNSLESHPGWEIYCARFDTIVKNQIEAKIFDPATSGEDRAFLVSARLLLVGANSPKKMLQSMLVQARSELDQIESKKR